MLVKFFLTCNKIGAFTLGGGYAMIPIMEQEFVDKNQWMNKQEFMDIMVVAQTTPGIFAIGPAFYHRHSHHRHVLPAFQGQLLGGQVLHGCAPCRGSTHCCTLLQDGKDGKHQPLQHLDSRCLLSADCSFRYLPYLHHHRSRCAGLALWKGKKVKI